MRRHSKLKDYSTTQDISGMKFFYSPGSCALATHLTLAEAGADYEAIVWTLLPASNKVWSI